MRGVILLNGPPRAGKDTAARSILERCPEWGMVRMSGHLKVATHAAYGLYDLGGAPLPEDHFEDIKDVPREEFFGLTPRQAYIAHSEAYMKPLHGVEVFGHLFVRRARALGAPITVVPDSGFADEANPVIKEYGADNVLLIRLHRPGFDFSNDSRSYISLPVETIDITNGEGQEALGRSVLKAVTHWVYGAII